MHLSQAAMPQPSMYRSSFEHDACGIGALANIKGVRSHQMVDDALSVLVNLEHRGGVGLERRHGPRCAGCGEWRHHNARQVIGNMPGVDRHHAAHGPGDLIDAEGLRLRRGIGLRQNKPPQGYIPVVDAGNGIFHFQLVYAVALLRDAAGHAVPQDTNAVGVKSCLCGLI